MHTYSQQFCERGGLEGISSVNLHALLLAWSKVKLSDAELLVQAKATLMEESLFEEGSENDLRGIM